MSGRSVEPLLDETQRAGVRTPDDSEPMADDNPKREADPTTNIEKDPDDWVSGDDPMTGAQGSYLKTLSEQAHEPGAYAPNLTKAEASQRIDALKRQIRERGGRAGGG